MKFSQYHIAPEIKKSLEEMGFKKPTDIQFKSIPPILKREDVLAIAQTGTGKTAAFAIPILHILHEQKYITPKGVKCIIMVPTHELAHQIKKVFDAIGQHTKIKTTVIHGGVDQAPQIEALQTSTDIVIGTPGKMFDLINQRVLDVKQVHTLGCRGLVNDI